MREIIEVALPLFLIMDPVANSAVALSLLQDLSPRRQRLVILRELLFALAIIVLFRFVGKWFMGLLEIGPSTLRLSGGIILFIISLKLLFEETSTGASDRRDEEPFIVPIAVPLIAGPSLLALVMLYSTSVQAGVLLPAIGLAWGLAAAIMLFSPSLTRILGQRGLRAAKRLMGLILVLLSVRMLEDGVRLFIDSLQLG